MTTGIILSIIVIVFIFSVKNYATKLSHGCCGRSGGDIKKTKPLDNNISNYNFAYKINTKGIACNHCKRVIENSSNKRN